MVLRRLALALLAVASGCSDASGPDDPTPTGLRVSAAPAGADTVDAMPIQALVVELRDDFGRPLSGRVIRFQAVPVQGRFGLQPSMFVAPAAASPFAFSEFTADTTDARGIALVLVRFGQLAGPGGIEVTAPENGAATRFDTTIRPGALTRVTAAPHDTTLRSGAQLQFRGGGTDHYGNIRSDPVSYVVLSGGPPVTISAAGVATPGSAFGSARVRLAVGALADTATIRVVPSGDLVAFDVSTSRFVVAALDGTVRSRHAVPSGVFPNPSLVDPVWFPDGAAFLYVGSPGGGPERLVRQALAGEPAFVSTDPIAGLGVQLSPTISSDGRTILFSGGNTSDGSRSIWRIDPDGTGARPVTLGLLHMHPTIEPTRQAVAYYVPGPEIRFAAVANGAAVGPVIPGAMPQYAPFSDRLSLLVGESIAVVNIDGSGFRIVTPLGARYAQMEASWSPDERWLLTRGEAVLELIEVATGLRIPLPWSTTLTQPVWRPGT